MQLMSWPDLEHYLCPVKSLVISLFLSLISTHLFSRTGGVLSHLNSVTQVLLISTEKLVFPGHAGCVFSCLRCNRHSLLLSSYLKLAELRILQCLRTLILGYLSSRSGMSSCKLFAPLTLWLLSVTV